MLFVKNYLFKSFRKYQNTSKLSTYVSELVELRIARDMIVVIITKLKNVWVFLGQTSECMF